MAKKIAVVFSGCGFLDGAEITESVSTLISLDAAGAEVKCFAPNKEIETINHLHSEAKSERRNVLEEAARISRGKIHDLKELKAADFDAICLPGGFGAAKHLCTFAKEGSQASMDENLKTLLQDFHRESKPIAAFCIAPALVALALGEHNVSLTIGNDKETAAEIEKTGAQHVECQVDDFVTDRENKVITSPAYMYDAQPSQVFTGISKAVKELMEMA